MPVIWEPVVSTMNDLNAYMNELIEETNKQIIRDIFTGEIHARPACRVHMVKDQVLRDADPNNLTDISFELLGVDKKFHTHYITCTSFVRCFVGMIDEYTGVLTELDPRSNFIYYISMDLRKVSCEIPKIKGVI